jgi:hypothetical protein
MPRHQIERVAPIQFTVPIDGGSGAEAHPDWVFRCEIPGNGKKGRWRERRARAGREPG